MSGGCCYITSKLIALNTDWELSFEFMKNGSSCAIQLVKNGITSRDTQVLKIQGDSNGQVFVAGVSSGRYWDPSFNYSNNIYYPVTIKKEGNMLTITSNQVTKIITSDLWDILELTSESLGIGVDTWGHTAYLKNVKLKIL